jgi:hypothetical protein
MDITPAMLPGTPSVITTMQSTRAKWNEGIRSFGSVCLLTC